MSSSEPSSSDEEEISESESSSDEGWDLIYPWDETLESIKENDPDVKLIQPDGEDIQDMIDEEWKELGRDIASNTHLTKVKLSQGALNDHKMSCLFRGLTRSTSIKEMGLYGNQLSAAGVRSMVPFLQNANSLRELDLDDNNLQTEGFNVLLRALSDSPIKSLRVKRCGVESVDIEKEHIPRQLKYLYLESNIINADGCRGLATLLQGGDAKLERLDLNRNKIDDDGVEILVNALKNNVSLGELYLLQNDAISRRGKISLLKLVNDISSIDATLRSNHTLTHLYTIDAGLDRHFGLAMEINMGNRSNTEAAGREKVIETQLHSKRRAELAVLQGVNHSVYSEIDPLHLPEVLALVALHNGQGELYIALRSSIAGVISTVNRKECLKQQRADLKARLEAIQAEIATIDAELVKIEAAEEHS